MNRSMESKLWRELAVSIACCVCSVCLIVIVGCEMSQSQRYQLASTTYTAAVATMTALSISGEVSLEDMERFEIVRAETEAMLEEWGAAIEMGQKYDGVVQFQMLLNRLLTIKLELEAHNGRSTGNTARFDDGEGWRRGSDRPCEARAA